jgi:hypothetical protein
LDFAILRVVGRYGSALQIILGLFVALIPVLLGIVTFLAIWLPMTKLLTNLS